MNMMDKQSAYLEAFLTSNQKFQSLEAYAEEHHVPIMDKVSMNFLCQLVNIQQPLQMLEVGTAIGYSAIKMISSLPKAHLITLERDQNMIDIATKNIEEHGLNNQIEIMPGDATDSLMKLQTAGNTFDFIFIDAAKAQYERFFTLAESLLDENGIIVCDNVLFKGFVADSEAATNPRLKKLAGKIDSFNRWLMKHKAFETSIVPIGDGLAISKKRS